MTASSPVVLDELLVEQHGAVLVMTINRPRARNAMTRDVALDLEAALAELDSREDLGAGVLTGAGGYFCAGMDLKRFLVGERPITDVGGFAGFVARPPAKPLIAAVEGPALAGGFEMALACDLIVAAESATFALPEVTRGLTAAAGGLMRLPQRIPYHQAMLLALTGQSLSAAQASAAGLLSMLVPDGQALTRALDLASGIAANAPLAVQASKAIVAGSRTWTAQEMFERQAQIVDPVRLSADAREGARAFVEKRRPVWRGQ